jgi:hypothetical protein
MASSSMSTNGQAANCSAGRQENVTEEMHETLGYDLVPELWATI